MRPAKWIRGARGLIDPMRTAAPRVRGQWRRIEQPRRGERRLPDGLPRPDALPRKVGVIPAAGQPGATTLMHALRKERIAAATAMVRGETVTTVGDVTATTTGASI